MVECKENETRIGNYCLSKEELDNVTIESHSLTHKVISMDAFGKDITILHEKRGVEVGVPTSVTVVFFDKDGSSISTNNFEVKYLREKREKYDKLKESVHDILSEKLD